MTNWPLQSLLVPRNVRINWPRGCLLTTFSLCFVRVISLHWCEVRDGFHAPIGTEDHGTPVDCKKSTPVAGYHHLMSLQTPFKIRVGWWPMLKSLFIKIMMMKCCQPKATECSACRYRQRTHRRRGSGLLRQERHVAGENKVCECEGGVIPTFTYRTWYYAVRI